MTAGNSSSINDGAAAVVMMTEENARNRGLTPLGRIVSSACTGVEPELMGTGPISAVEKAVSICLILTTSVNKKILKFCAPLIDLKKLFCRHRFYRSLKQGGISAMSICLN